MMKTLVTGGAGFIGSHLVEALLAAGHRVRVLDNLSSGKRENLASVAQDIEFIEGDVRNLETCERACEGIDRVWHLGAIASVPASVADPVATHEANATGTLNMLVASKDSDVGRLVFASSCAVYGDNPELPREESQRPAPMSPYATSKLAGEIYVRQFAGLYGLETVALRYFNIFGPRQDPKSEYAAVAPIFISMLLDGRQPLIYGDGEQSREFVYVADCVRCNMLAGFSDAPGVVGEHFNVAPGRPTTVNELLDTIQNVLGSNITPRYLPERPGDIRLSDANVEKIVTRLGFRPEWSLEDGIRETVKSLRHGLPEPELAIAS
jgi:UDP-glucose 4-epimerase